MKQDNVAKMYRLLTNKERAALAFRYMADANELEIERVAAAVPWKSYEGPDIEFKNWINGFFALANYWGLTHWQLYARKLAALGSIHILFNQNERDKADLAIDAHSHWEARLLALDLALLSICEENGIDPNAVRRLADAEPYFPILSDLASDAEFQAEMLANFNRLLDAWPKKPQQ